MTTLSISTGAFPYALYLRYFPSKAPKTVVFTLFSVLFFTLLRKPAFPCAATPFDAFHRVCGGSPLSVKKARNLSKYVRCIPSFSHAILNAEKNRKEVIYDRNGANQGRNKKDSA